MAAERRQAIQQQRHLPDDLVQALRKSNLLRIMQPAHWGGYEMDLGTFVRVATEIAKGDTSTGWVFCILGIHHFWIGYVEPELQQEIWGRNTEVIISDSFAPVGVVEPMPGGYRLSGPVELLERAVVERLGRGRSPGGARTGEQARMDNALFAEG